MESTSKLSQEPQLDWGYIDISHYLPRLREGWWLIATVAMVVVITTALIDEFLVTKWYRSQAVLRPIATSAVESRISGLLGGLGGGLTGLGGLAASVGGGSSDADEYLAIMNGFAFNLALAQRHQLSAELLASLPWYRRLADYLNPGDSQWEIYRILQDRFESYYSQNQGNIALHFTARSTDDAKRILGYYIDDLRDLLRSREVTVASEAIESLRAEALSTSDPVLRSELYSLEAKQLQRKKMAQIEPDFAFRVLDPPATPDKKYSPKVTFDCAIAGLLAALGTAIFVLFRFRPDDSAGASGLHEPPIDEAVARIPRSGKSG
jgi:LPS O-antigen subunit length determinant protein (WzzB/FepE family)